MTLFIQHTFLITNVAKVNNVRNCLADDAFCGLAGKRLGLRRLRRLHSLISIVVALAAFY